MTGTNALRQKVPDLSVPEVREISTTCPHKAVSEEKAGG